jgi:hypothetical protein
MYISLLLENHFETHPLGRPRRRWDFNIEMDLGETGSEDGRWMELA